MKKKILLYGDLNLNIVDGSSVWLYSLAKLLSNDPNNCVDILLKVKIENDVLVKDLYYRNNVTLINCDEYCPKYKEVDKDNIVEIVEKMDSYRDYSCIIMRGYSVVTTVINSDVIVDKLIPYLTDFCHDEKLISQKEKDELKYIYDKVKQFFVQTKQMKKYLIKVLSVDGKKFQLLSPMIFMEKEDNTIKYPKSIVYAGKIAQYWNVLELIDIMDELYKKDKDITLYMIGDKFNRELAHRKDEIIAKLKSMPNVKFYGTLPKSKTTEIVKKCELAYSFRSVEIDNNHSLEIASKLLEYCFCNIPVLIRKTNMHTDILGDKYPLYVESVEECIDKIYDYFNKPDRFKSLKKIDLSKCVEEFTPDNTYKNIKKALDFYPDKKMRVLITGHDLKFIKSLYPYFENNYDLTIQQYDEYMDMNENESKELLKKCDIIWCEWLLYNAEWYSSHKYPHQRLIIRAHRFELSRKFGRKVKWSAVEKLIVVSYYYQEQFIERFKIPRYKVRVVSNYIDTSSYPTTKNPGFEYNLSMIGILPKRKGYERAIDILNILKKKDQRYKLFIAGKRPEEFPNTKNDPEEWAYYQAVEKKVQDLGLEDSVIFTGWIDVHEFLKDIGYTLSLSDKEFPESFHISPFECMVSNGLGLCLRWDGIEYIYPENVIYDTIEEIANKIDYYNHNIDEYHKLAKMSREFTIENYDIKYIWKIINKIVDGEES